MFEFNVLSGTVIKDLLSGNVRRSIDSVTEAYMAHHNGKTVNPDSYFLRFPSQPDDRIIALPASIDGDIKACGIKWISSFPENVAKGIPRASAVLILNDTDTGYPYACLEGSLISAARTAASAVLGAFWLNRCTKNVKNISFVGAGIIARNILETFISDGWSFESITIHDSDEYSMKNFSEFASKLSGSNSQCETSLETVLKADVVVFATNAGTPYVCPPNKFHASQIVLNISLRDIHPDLVLNSENIFDDVDHCLKANTSPHLAEQKIGDRRFVTGTIAQLMAGEISVDYSRPLIYSPFGMGILDLALGKALYDEAVLQGLTVDISGFFGETSRW